MTLPERILTGLPAGLALDGEVFAGRAADGWDLSCEAVNRGRWDFRCFFKVFDCPDAAGGWEERMRVAGSFVGVHPFVHLVPGVKLEGLAHAVALLDRVKGWRGEGLMLRDPEAPYVVGRHQTLLKMKFVPELRRPSLSKKVSSYGCEKTFQESCCS